MVMMVVLPKDLSNGMLLWITWGNYAITRRTLVDCKASFSSPAKRDRRSRSSATPFSDALRIASLFVVRSCEKGQSQTPPRQRGREHWVLARRLYFEQGSCRAHPQPGSRSKRPSTQLRGLRQLGSCRRPTTLLHGGPESLGDRQGGQRCNLDLGPQGNRFTGRM